MKRILTSIILISSSTFAADNTTTYNIFAIPSVSIQESLNKIGLELSEFKLHGLFEDGYSPHITLYMSSFPKEELPNIINAINDVTSNRKAFPIQIVKEEKTKQNWLMLNIRKNIELQVISDEITANVFTKRALSAPPTWVNAYPAKAEYFMKYGSPNVFEEFEPHITVLSPSNSKNIDDYLHKYSFTPFEVNVIGIGIAEADKFGQHKHEIYKSMF